MTINASRADLPQPGADVAMRRETIPTAIEYAADRLDRIEHVLGDLNGVVMRAGSQLGPILSGGGYAEPPTAPADPSPGEDPTRSTIARQVTALGRHADDLADVVTAIRHRLEAVLDGVEL